MLKKVISSAHSTIPDFSGDFDLELILSYLKRLDICSQQERSELRLLMTSPHFEHLKRTVLREGLP